jgi:hypothetical protein
MSLCPNYGTKNPDDAGYCIRCGKSLSNEHINIDQPQKEPSHQPQNQSSNGLSGIIIIGVILVILVFVFGLGQHNVVILNGSTSVNALGYRYFWFDVPSIAINPTISGTFTGSGSLGNDIRVYVLTSTDFINWINGHQVSTYYNSGVIATASFSVKLVPGQKYYLVFDNTFSLFSGKNVIGDITFSYFGFK